MKKIYTVLAIIAFFGSSIIAADEPTFIITDIQTSELGDESLVFQGAKHNASLKVSVRNAENNTHAGPINLPCLGEGLYDYPYIDLANSNTFDKDSKDHSFILIESTGEANILKVEFIAGSSLKSEIVCSASIDGNDYLDGYVDSNYALLAQLFEYSAGSISAGMCNPKTFTIPDNLTDLFQSKEPISDFISKAKFVRFNWGKSFAGLNPTKGGITSVFGLKIYTDADTSLPTNISENKHETLEVSLDGYDLTLSRAANITIYDITGKIIAKYDDISTYHFDSIESGIYIISAIANDGESTTEKIVIK